MAIINLFGMQFQDIQVIIALEIIFATCFLIGWFLYNKNKFRAFIVEPYLKSWKIVKVLKIRNDVDTFKKKIGKEEKEFKKDFSVAIIDEKNKPIIFYNTNDALPISPLTGMQTKVESKAFNTFIKATQIRHLGEKLGAGNILIYIIVALIIGIILIAIWAIYNQNLMNQQIIELTKQLANATKTSNNGGIVVIP